MSQIEKQIAAFVNDLKVNKKFHVMDEASIKQAVVLRLLSLLGWDIFNVEEVYPDFPSGAVQISYALCLTSNAKVFIEVRRAGGGLEDIHETLVKSAAQQAVELAVHTDGSRWWFYLPAAQGTLNQKQCLALDVSESLSETMAADLIAFLSRANVASEKYMEAAFAAYRQQMRKMAADVLPAAWNNILTQLDPALIEVLSAAAEKICGCKPELSMVERFIRMNQERWVLSSESPVEPSDCQKPDEQRGGELPPVSGKSSDIKNKKPEFFAGKAVLSFTFQGNTFPVKSWDEMLIKLCNVFVAAHPRNFEKVLWLYDNQTPCFTRYSDQLKIPQKIKKTNIYVETKLPPEEIVKTMGDLLTEFGYRHDELVITTS